MGKEVDPRMHSAEHILNRTMDLLFQSGRCFSAHIEKKKSKCDYHFDRMLSSAELREVEHRVNEVIGADLDVREEYVSREDAQGQYSLDRLPDEAGDRIRVIRIGDYDACPCIGPHVSSTREIGRFRISSSSHEQSVLRIRFKLDHLPAGPGKQ